MDGDLILALAIPTLGVIAVVGCMVAAEAFKATTRQERARALSDLNRLRLDEAKSNGSFMRLLGRPSDSNPFNPAEGYDGVALANQWFAGWTEADVNLRDLERKGACS